MASIYGPNKGQKRFIRKTLDKLQVFVEGGNIIVTGHFNWSLKTDHSIKLNKWGFVGPTLFRPCLPWAGHGGIQPVSPPCVALGEKVNVTQLFVSSLRPVVSHSHFSEIGLNSAVIPSRHWRALFYFLQLSLLLPSPFFSRPACPLSLRLPVPPLVPLFPLYPRLLLAL